MTLKTLVLLALMAQSGLHVPAREGARLPVFAQVFAIVGDDQSVAENLSTFSAFVKQLSLVLEDVDEQSLVLLDELGAGTDPDDGAALAQAVLETLAERGAFSVASTHLEPLKGFASSPAPDHSSCIVPICEAAICGGRVGERPFARISARTGSNGNPPPNMSHI